MAEDVGLRYGASQTDPRVDATPVLDQALRVVAPQTVVQNPPQVVPSPFSVGGQNPLSCAVVPAFSVSGSACISANAGIGTCPATAGTGHLAVGTDEVIGTDPGGTNALRVGGSATISVGAAIGTGPITISGQIITWVNTVTGYIQVDATPNMIFSVGNTIRMTILGASGLVEIATACAVGTDILGGGPQLRVNSEIVLQNASSVDLQQYISGGAADQKYWDMFVQSGSIAFRAVNDAFSSANPWLTVTRGAGFTISNATYSALLIGNAGVEVSGTSGFLGIGIAPTTWAGIYNVPALTGSNGSTQYGFINQPQFNSGVSGGSARLIQLGGTTLAGAYTISDLEYIRIFDMSLGSGSAVTTQYGILIGALTSAATNYAINTSTGYVLLGDITGVGGQPLIGTILNVTGTPPSLGTATTLFGIASTPTFPSTTTSQGVVYYSVPQTAAAAFTCGSIYGYYAGNATKGAGSTITTQYGIFVTSLTSGATNYAIFTNAGLVQLSDKVSISPQVDGNTQLAIVSLNTNHIVEVFANNAGTCVVGTATNDSLQLVVNGNTRWLIDTSGNLTANTSNGGYVAFRPGAAATTAKAVGVLYTNGGISESVSSNSSATALTYSLPANTLNGTTQMLRFTIGCHRAAGGTFTGSAFIVITVNGVSLASQVDMTADGHTAYATGLLVYLTSTTASYNSLGLDTVSNNVATAPNTLILNESVTGLAWTSAQNVLVNVTGNGGTGSSTVVLDVFLIEWLSS